MRRLIIGMTGSTGAIFGVRLLEALKHADDVESHLVISKWAQRTIEHETNYTVEQVRALATVVHSPGDMGATLSSGSFLTEGMVVIPCSVRTLGGIAQGVGDHLVHRAADVVLKERRKLVLVVRETPLSEVHLENMLKLSRMGVVMGSEQRLQHDGQQHQQHEHGDVARAQRHKRTLPLPAQWADVSSGVPAGHRPFQREHDWFDAGERL
jgi:4-hydroxy-3-polyprenylbenzoate decarboxylase